MLSRIRAVFLLAALSFSLALHLVAVAQTEEEPDQGEEASENQEEPEINRREATDLARKAYSGKVLSVRLVEDEWRVRMDDEGTIFNVHVDAATGEVTRPD